MLGDSAVALIISRGPAPFEVVVANQNNSAVRQATFHEDRCNTLIGLNRLLFVELPNVDLIFPGHNTQ